MACLWCPFPPRRTRGIDELIEHALRAAEHKQRPRRQDFCTGAVHRCIHGIAHMIEDHAQAAGVPPYFAATKLVEGDEPMQKRLRLTDNELDLIGHSVTEMEAELGTDREAALADMRYTFIEKLCAATVVKHGESREHARSVRLDKVLTGKYTGIPIFSAYYAGGVLAYVRRDRHLPQRFVKRGHRRPHGRRCRRAGRLRHQPGGALACDRRRVCGRGQRAQLSAHYCDAVFLPFHAGRFRLYGARGLCDG